MLSISIFFHWTIIFCCEFDVVLFVYFFVLSPMEENEFKVTNTTKGSRSL